jgi:hypothetical protein
MRTLADQLIGETPSRSNQTTTPSDGQNVCSTQTPQQYANRAKWDKHDLDSQHRFGPSIATPQSGARLLRWRNVGATPDMTVCSVIVGKHSTAATPSSSCLGRCLVTDVPRRRLGLPGPSRSTSGPAPKLLPTPWRRCRVALGPCRFYCRVSVFRARQSGDGLDRA